MARRLDGEVQVAMIIYPRKIFLVLLMLIELLTASYAIGGSRFVETSPCSNAVKTCVGGRGTRTIEGFEVTRDCWEWSYVKTCNYPSKNNCRLYEHCYAVGDIGCLLKDSLGSCVNLQREFSCKSWDVINKENQTVRMGFEEKPGKDGLICKGMPCIDGNCVDKGYETNGEMMDSLSKLYAISNMNPDKDGKFNLFQGSNQHCDKKPMEYSNCCQIGGKGWGKSLGAKCTKDEQILIDMRSKKLCVYVGKDSTKKMGVTVVNKHRFCCFGNLLDKVIQVEGRKQLGRSFGTGTKPDCRGLSLEDIQRIDWSLVDFGEFIEDLKVKFAGTYKTPNAGELASTVEVSINSIRKYDDDPTNPANNMSGWNSKIKDDSTEAEEERRLEAERAAHLERERLASQALEKEKAERLERERLASQALERERLARLEQQRREQERVNHKLNKEKELALAIKWEQEAIRYWGSYGQYNSNKDAGYPGKPYSWNAAEWNKVVSAGDKVRRIKGELEGLK
jgi:hypothetical protein